MLYSWSHVAYLFPQVAYVNTEVALPFPLYTALGTENHDLEVQLFVR